MDFNEAIKTYLDSRAKQDELFAVTYQKENKSIEECCKYILSEARKLGSEVCMSDDEVYGLAVHYYDEDDIKIESVSRHHVATSVPVELTEEDKEAAKRRAIERYSSEILSSMKKKPKKVESSQQMSLF